MIEIDRAEYPASANLLRLLSVRVSLFAATMLAIGLVARFAGFELPLDALVATLAALAAMTLIGWRRAVAAPRAVRDAEVLLHIGIDIAALTTLLYFTGGWTNPLVSLYLVPIAAAAVMLPRRLAWVVAVGTVVSYAVIARFYRPLAFENAAFGAFTLHMAGMWLTFIMAAALIAYLGTTMSATLRARAQALANAREANLRNEQIIGVATLAAGTAHELSTPLSSIAVIASEMRADAAAEQRQELDLIVEQIELCKDILRRLRDAAAPSDQHRPGQRIDDFMADIHERFTLLRPGVEVEFRCDGEQPSPLIDADPTLRQAVLNLLDNAADASPHAVDCRARWTAHEVTFDIRDRGAGFDAARRAGLRVAPVSKATTPNADSEGMGMGFMLANATIERLGGAVRVADRDGGGTWLQVTLPLAADAR